MIEQELRLNQVQITLGNKIKELRQQKGWPSQESFAAACGIDRTYLGQIERGEANACLSILAEITKKLDITISGLFEDIA
ncbi:MAG TPA: helix-turn-helix transcriptional regulator [Candidatus Angelobacter sp.]|jgi:transcriptional regulator with XRE-family HTH domain|nr:helix-turn-helix transcriptional regulator [Candidatus Angelobacter sp.]